jgi:hypothetical protein
MNGRSTIGFDRKIELEWLDAVAGRAAAGDTPEKIRKFLWEFLDGVVAGDSVHSGRGKTLTVLFRIWVIVPEWAKPLRDLAFGVHSVGDPRAKGCNSLGNGYRDISVLLRCRCQCWKAPRAQ